MKKERIEKNRKILSVSAVIITVLAIAFLSYYVGVPLVKFASEPEKFRAWVDSHGVLGRLGFMGMIILQVVVALIPGEPFEIAAGYAFGTLEGTVIYLIAAALGSVIVFLLVRKFGVKLVEVFFEADKLKKLKFLKTSSRRSILFLLIFMIPGTPKDLLCYFAGLTDMSFPAWLLICSLGRIPSVVTSTVGGDALGTGNVTFAVVVFAVTLVISVGGILIYNKLSAAHKNDTDKK